MTLRTVTFSPTGTTAKIVSAIASGIMDTIKCESIICDTTYRPAETFVAGPDDITVIAAPVYGGKMAPIAKNRLTAIKGPDSPCVLVAVYGNRAFENALNDMADFATSLGFMPVAAGAFIGEHSYSSPATPIAVGRPDADDMETSREFGRNIGGTSWPGRLNGSTRPCSMTARRLKSLCSTSATSWPAIKNNRQSRPANFYPRSTLPYAHSVANVSTYALSELSATTV